MTSPRKSDLVFPESPQEDDTKKEKKHPSHLKNLSFYFTEYCDCTSIHGLKFLGEKGRFFIEKVWWSIFISVSLYFCISLIISTYNKWMTAPVIVSFATSETAIWKIPFPAVTVCPLIQAVKSQYDYSEVLKQREAQSENDEESARLFRYMSLVCPNTINIILDENATDTIDDRVINFLIQVAPNFDNTTFRCNWAGEDCTYSIDKFFMPIITSLGVCYTLNMVDWDELFTEQADVEYYNDFSIEHQPLSHWNIDSGYFGSLGFDAYPRRTPLSGPNGGLDLVFYTDGRDVDYSCGDSLQGYKILLHHPAEMPRANQKYFWLPLNQEVSASVKPNMMTTSAAIRRYKPRDRKCYFTKEKTLKFFRIYSQQNCLIECLANYTTLQDCGCVAFYMPRDNSTPICGSTMKPCMSQVNVELLAREAILEMRKSKTKKSRYSAPKPKKTYCDCLPSCHSLQYDVETSQLDWDWRRGNILGSDYSNETSHLSRLKIFFKDLQFLTSERNELYGQTEFWANCGGLLGLFTGFSFISVVEVLYFATLRFVCNIKKYGHHYWSGADKLLYSKGN